MKYNHQISEDYITLQNTNFRLSKYSSITILIIFLLAVLQWFSAISRDIGILGIVIVCLIYGSYLLLQRRKSAVSHTNRQILYVRSYLDSLQEGILISDTSGIVHFANQYYLALAKSENVSESCSVEHLFANQEENSKAIYRLSQAAREQKIATENLYLNSNSRKKKCYCVSVRPYIGEPNEDSQPNLIFWKIQEIADSEESQNSENMNFQDKDNIKLLFKSVFDDMSISVTLVNQHSEIIRQNSSFSKKFASEKKSENQNHMLTNLLVDKDREKLRIALTEVLTKKVAQSIDVEFGKQLDGQSATLFISNLVQSSDSEQNLLIFIFETTQFRTLEVQFAQSQKMQAIGQLAGGVAHDFNNVLTAIIGAVDLLLANHRNTDPSFQDIMSIKNNANRASALIRQLLAFSRRQMLVPKEINLNDHLSDLVHLLQSLLGEKISVQITSGKELWSVMADATQFDQVLINLAINARDAMPNGGKLTIRAENVPTKALSKFAESTNLDRSDYVLLEVTDTGTGMSKELTEKIFEPFFSTKDVGEGTGLGLSTVYGIIEQSGGYIFPESQEGQGTRFRIFLPRHIPVVEKPVAETTQESITSVDLTGNATILLVEDDESVRFFAKRALTSRGYSVLEANSGMEALNILSNNELQVDLIVSDVVMPEMDGPTLLSEVRKSKPNMKVYFYFRICPRYF